MKKLLILVLSLLTVTAVMVFGIACGEEPAPTPEHTHTYETTWSKDANYHWHKATCDHTDQAKDLGEHEFVNGECTICGYVEIPSTNPGDGNQDPDNNQGGQEPGNGGDQDGGNNDETVDPPEQNSGSIGNAGVENGTEPGVTGGWHK